jgi:hypothetical protein
MRNLILLSLICLTLVPATFQPAAAQEAEATRYRWEYIAYPTLPTQPDGFPAPVLTLYNREHAGLEFRLSYYVPRTAAEPRKGLPSAEKITVRLHSADGKVSDPAPDEWRGAIGLTNGKGTTYTYIYHLPWKRNVLEEACIEVRLPQQAYWVELPYGFTRDPPESLTPVEPRRGMPAFAATMKPGDTDRLVSWLHVHYDLGRIQNGWGLSVNLSNPFDAEAEVVLYRDDLQVGKSMYLWKLHSPTTTVAIKQPGERVLESRGMSICLHEDGMRRSDCFKFNRNFSDGDRCWGTIIIRVDDKSYECVIPSSLFRYVHGVADPCHKAAVSPRGND